MDFALDLGLVLSFSDYVRLVDLSMEEMGRRFEGSLVLSEREARGLKIGGSAMKAVLQYQFSLVCKVLTVRSFRRRSFMDLFTRLWGGDKWVLISDVEDERFLVRFLCEDDMVRVLDREPWEFDRSLIVMGRLNEAASVIDVRLSSDVFWVQAHGVPVRFRILEVAVDIGGLVGELVEVKSGEDGGCVGRFLRSRVRMDLSLALLRRTVVEFPVSGEHLVEFQYEGLPEFCQECGIIGHPTRVYDERLGITFKADSERPFPASLRADKDLHGRRLGHRVGRGRFEGSLSGAGRESGSDSRSWTRSVETKVVAEKVAAVVVEGTLQIEGPMQDTASSPIKDGE